jgi:hypothetical protein
MNPVVEIFTHLKALYEEQWGDAEATAPPEVPGQVKEDLSSEKTPSHSVNISAEENIEVAS